MANPMLINIPADLKPEQRIFGGVIRLQRVGTLLRQDPCACAW
jgi:hypothetical protein